MRISTLLLVGVVMLGAPVATAQDLTVERDGTEVTITRPDGTVERFTVAEDAPLRVRVKDGPLLVEREGEAGPHRRFEMQHDDDGPNVWFERDGEGPRAFAFRTKPDGAMVEFDDFDFEADVDSALHRMLRFRGVPGDVGMAFGEEGLMPWPGFGGRGIEPETRRGIADGERESRDLARQLRRAEGAERERLTRELRATLEQTFDLKQQARREQIEHLQQSEERLQSDLAERNEALAERERARREIIERRERDLLGEGDELDW
ncbi:MAG: hypothetical protein ABJF88_06305 [Rhodothermales bacterium]